MQSAIIPSLDLPGLESIAWKRLSQSMQSTPQCNITCAYCAASGQVSGHPSWDPGLRKGRFIKESGWWKFPLGSGGKFQVRGVQTILHWRNLEESKTVLPTHTPFTQQNQLSNELDVCLHDTARLYNRFDNRVEQTAIVCSTVLNEQPLFVQPVVKPGCTTGCIYTIQPVVKPVVKPVWQQVVSCKQGFSITDDGFVQPREARGGVGWTHEPSKLWIHHSM